MGYLQNAQVIDQHWGTGVPVRPFDFAEVADEGAMPNEFTIMRQCKHVAAFKHDVEPVLIDNWGGCATANGSAD